MNFLGLNCRGLGLDAAVGELRDLCRSYNLGVVFLCETKKRAKEMDKLKWSLGFVHGVAVDCRGKSGGLALWWRDGIVVSVRPWCQYYIDAKIVFKDKVWRFTGIYGEPQSELRSRTWEALRYLHAQDDLPWLCVGDFKEIMLPTEQLGGNPGSQANMAAFRDCLNACGLQDLGYRGYDYTWNNKREGSENIQVRLDRGTATAPFLDLFPLTSVEHIVTEESDHMALLIKVWDEPPQRLSNSSRGFMFEEMWLKHEGFEEMIKTSWDNRDLGDRSIAGL
jgi:hypothetical protein